MRNAYNILVGQPVGERPLGRPTRAFKDNVKVDSEGIEYSGVDWINLTQDMTRNMVILSMVLIFRVP
jgi:hypothetical protein